MPFLYKDGALQTKPRARESTLAFFSLKKAKKQSITAERAEMVEAASVKSEVTTEKKLDKPETVQKIEELPKEVYDVEIVEQREVRLMNELADDTGAYWKRWTIKNTGNVQWSDEKVQVGEC